MNVEQRTPAATFQERYSVLVDVARVLNSTLRTGELYRAIHQQAIRVLDCTGFYIALYDEAEDMATVVFAAERGEASFPGLRYRGSESPAIREGRPAISHTGEIAARQFAALGVHVPSRCSLHAPMVREGRVLGLISAHSEVEDQYAWEDLELLAAIGDLAAVAVENARHLGQMERRRREAERLEEIGRALTSSLELSHVLGRIVEAAVELLRVDSASVWLFREGMAELAMAGGDPAAAPGRDVVPVPEEIFRRILGIRTPLILDDVSTSDIVPPELRSIVRTRSAAVVPLRLETRVLGALALGQVEPRAFGPADLRLLERLADQAAIAVENARLHAEIRALSLTDPLTGLPNRRQLELYLEREFAAARRGRALSVVLFDLDHFKEYNDAEGHQAGDVALQRFAEVLMSQTRTMNLVARLGGDEFVAVLSGSDEEGARHQVERVRRAMARDPVLERIGVSAGLAGYRDSLDSPWQIIAEADRSLYRAKADRAGEDRRVEEQAHS